MRGDIEYGEVGFEGPPGRDGAPAFSGEKGHEGNFIAICNPFGNTLRINSFHINGTKCVLRAQAVDFSI